MVSYESYGFPLDFYEYSTVDFDIAFVDMLVGWLKCREAPKRSTRRYGQEIKRGVERQRGGLDGVEGEDGEKSGGVRGESRRGDRPGEELREAQVEGRLAAAEKVGEVADGTVAGAAGGGAFEADPLLVGREEGAVTCP